MKRLAIVTTHPIQYYAPIFKLLQERGKMAVKIFYTWGEASTEKYDPGFNKTIEWDIPLLEGYEFEWVKNVSKKPGSDHFNGIVTPWLVEQIATWQPDAVLFFGWAYNGHLKAIRFFKNRIPVFFRGDSTSFDQSRGIKGLLKTILLKWVYKHIDHAFYVGTNNKAYFKQYGLKDKQLSFAPHAIDNDRFGADKHEDAILLRQELGSLKMMFLFCLRENWKIKNHQYYC